MNVENRVERVSSFHPVQKFFLLFFISMTLCLLLFWSLDGLDLKKIFAERGWFKIESVEIEAGWPLSKKEVSKWLPTVEGESLLSLDVDKVVENLESKNWVKSVVIQKRYPDRVSINVSTKVPKAIYLVQGRPFYLDSSGNIIEHVSSRVAKKHELPIITMQEQSTLIKWELAEAIELVDKFSDRLGKHFALSEVFLETYPYFRIYLSVPRVEVLFSHRNWESQVPRLLTLISNPPSQLSQIARINLVFPKKAIVSSTLSN